MKVIGIVGGSGAGKTTALGELTALNGALLDCDAIYHELLRTSEELKSGIEARFGPVFDENGLNRQKLGAVVFADPEALRDLNAIALGVLVPELRRRIEAARQQGRSCVAIDGATLLESELARDCDALVAVVAPTEDRVRRIMAREGISEDYARARIAAQRSDEWLRQRCDHVLVNDCSPEEFRARARAIFAAILHEEETGE